MVFILYKPYLLSPYTNSTPKPTPYRKLCAFLLSQKNEFSMIYKPFELWGHWNCPHKSPSPWNTCHVIIQICPHKPHKHARTPPPPPTHTHTRVCTHTHPSLSSLEMLLLRSNIRTAKGLSGFAFLKPNAKRNNHLLHSCVNNELTQLYFPLKMTLLHTCTTRLFKNTSAWSV